MVLNVHDVLVVNRKLELLGELAELHARVFVLLFHREGEHFCLVQHLRLLALSPSSLNVAFDQLVQSFVGEVPLCLNLAKLRELGHVVSHQARDYITVVSSTQVVREKLLRVVPDLLVHQLADVVAAQ